jgi:hypothetical protein
MGVETGGGGRGMSQILLNQAQVDSRLQQMGCPARPQRMNRRVFVEATVFEGFPERALHAAPGHRVGGGRQADSPTTRRWEDQHGMAMRDPIPPKPFQRPVWQGDIPIFPSFATTDVKQQASAVDLWDLKMGAFLKAQTAGVDRREADPVAQESDTAEKLSNFFDAEDDWKLFLAWGANKGEGGPRSAEGLLEEELDAAERDCARTAGVVLDILEIEEVLSEFFLRDHVGGLVRVVR